MFTQVQTQYKIFSAGYTRHDINYIAAISGKYGGVNEINFASLIIEGSTYFTQYEGVSFYLHVPYLPYFFYKHTISHSERRPY
jgi:hypothetical protein